MAFDSITYSTVNKIRPLIGEAVLVPNTFTSEDYVDTGTVVDAKKYPGLASSVDSGFSGETWEQVALPTILTPYDSLGNLLDGGEVNGYYVMIFQNGRMFRSNMETMEDFEEVKDYAYAGTVLSDAIIVDNKIFILGNNKRLLVVLDEEGSVIKEYTLPTSLNWLRKSKDRTLFVFGPSPSSLYNIDLETLGEPVRVSHGITEFTSNMNLQDLVCDNNYYYMAFKNGKSGNVFVSSSGQAGTWSPIKVGGGLTNIISIASVGNAVLVALEGSTGTAYRLQGTSIATLSTSLPLGDVRKFTTSMITSGEHAGKYVVADFSKSEAVDMLYDPSTRQVTSLMSSIQNVLPSARYRGGSLAIGGSKIAYIETSKDNNRQRSVTISSDLFQTIDHMSYLYSYDSYLDAPVNSADGKILAMMTRDPTLLVTGLRSLAFVHSATGIKSNDGGETWEEFKITVPEDITPAVWTNLTKTDTKFVIGAFLKNENQTYTYSGEAWIGVSEDLENWTWQKSSGFSISNNDAPVIQCVGENIIFNKPRANTQTVLRCSTDYGISWEDITMSAFYNIWAHPTSGKIYAVHSTIAGTKVSSDGLNWEPVGDSSTIAFTFPTNCVATGELVAVFGGNGTYYSSSKLLLSTDGGENWGVYDLPVTSTRIGYSWAAGGIVGITDLLSNKYWYTKDGINWSESMYGGMTSTDLYSGETSKRIFEAVSTTTNGSKCFILGDFYNNKKKMLVSKTESFIPPVTGAPNGLKYVIRARN